MLKVAPEAEGCLEEARAHAEANGLADQLQSQLDRLDRMYDGGNEKTRCVLTPDFAPWSFQFVILRCGSDGWKPVLNGGLIYHDGGWGGGWPTFSVQLEPSKGWQIHT